VVLLLDPAFDLIPVTASCQDDHHHPTLNPSHITLANKTSPPPAPANHPPPKQLEDVSFSSAASAAGSNVLARCDSLINSFTLIEQQPLVIIEIRRVHLGPATAEPAVGRRGNLGMTLPEMPLEPALQPAAHIYAHGGFLGAACSMVSDPKWAKVSRDELFWEGRCAVLQGRVLGAVGAATAAHLTLHHSQSKHHPPLFADPDGP